jgi:hypothetical protein
LWVLALILDELKQLDKTYGRAFGALVTDCTVS